MTEDFWLETLFDHIGGDGTEEEALSDQGFRRLELHIKMNNQADALRRSAKLVDDILRQNEQRLQVDEEGRLIIVGQLAFYRMDLHSFISKMVNPFAHHSFDMIEVHPKSGLVDSPLKACVQVHQPSNMPAYDFLGGYILGLLNDEFKWLDASMEPLRRVLMQVYGLAISPLTKTLEQHLETTVGGEFDHMDGTFTFHGTNGWRWRLSYHRPLAKGCKLEYQKPRQAWWNVLFEDHIGDTSGHHTLLTFMSTVEHLSRCPAMLKDSLSWESDPVFVREVALNYPPLRRVLMKEIEHEDYDPNVLSDPWDDGLNSRDSVRVAALDARLRELAAA